jgi:acetyl esterase/lipase
MAFYFAHSAAQTQNDSFVVRSGITYASGLNGPLKADVYIPRAQKKLSPAILMIHGGGWRSGDRMQVAKLARELAGQHYVSFSIDYDLVPAHFPVALNECREALRFLVLHSSEFGIDPARIAVLGSSAGGELAALLALDSSDGETSRIRAAVILNGVLDLPALGDQNGMVTDYIGGLCSKRQQVCEQASPSYQVKPGAPIAFFVGHGTADVIVPFVQSQKFAEALRQSNYRVTTFVAEGGPHTYWLQPEFYEKNLSALLKFLSSAMPQEKTR